MYLFEYFFVTFVISWKAKQPIKSNDQFADHVLISQTSLLFSDQLPHDLSNKKHATAIFWKFINHVQSKNQWFKILKSLSFYNIPKF